MERRCWPDERFRHYNRGDKDNPINAFGDASDAPNVRRTTAP